MARKVFISVLGTGYYNRTKYYWKEKNNYIETRFVQEATLKLLTEHWCGSDQAYFFLTKNAKKTNWTDPAQKNDRRVKNGERDTYKGLGKRLEEGNYPFIYEYRDIPDGNTEEEIWEIFQSVFDVLQEGDELHFDITHAFRSIPMLVMVLINYAKFLKNITVRRITYGNWEGRNEENFAPIIDLTTFSELQDWTSAANEFLNYGYSERIKELYSGKISELSSKDKNRLMPFIKSVNDFSSLFSTVRGREIIAGDEFIQLSDGINIIEKNSEIIVLKPILDKLKTSLSKFQKNSIINGFIAIEWCVEHKMIQQAITLTQEMVITYLCDFWKEKYHLNFRDKAHREAMNSLFGVINNNVSEDGWKGSLQENIETFRKIKEEELFKKITKVFNKLTQIRNSINHAGFVGVMTATEIEKNFKKYYKEIKDIINI